MSSAKKQQVRCTIVCGMGKELGTQVESWDSQWVWVH